MATKSYWMKFGSGDPRTYTGLAPTFLIFSLADGTAITPPAIAEHPASSGLYTFAWGTTTSIGFLADAATTSPGTSGRYVTGALDPADEIDFYGTSLVAIGTSLTALGTTSVALGTTSVSWGSANSTALTNVGTTLVAIGNTSITGLNNIGTTLIAQGSTLVAIGNTSIAYGGTILFDVVNFGSTLVGIGNTAIALGTTSVSWGSVNNTALTNVGTTLVAIGNTSIAIGSTNSQKITNEGLTLVAIGNTAIAFYETTILADVVGLGITLVAIGNTSIAIGTSMAFVLTGIGTTASLFGDSTTNPPDLFGYMKRIQENLEGNNTYVKGTGVLSIYARTGTTLLITKTVTNSVTTVIKT